jgi:hypothetical protein
MAGSEIAHYATELRGHLAALGVATPALDELVDAAQALATAVDSAPETLTQQAWQEVSRRWVEARGAIEGYLADILLGALADVPGLEELAADATALSHEGIHGEADVGPVHLSVSSSTLVIQPPRLLGGVLPDPIPVGPFQVGAIAAHLSSPFGGGKGLPGGGSIVRLPGDIGFGGTLQLPLGPVQVSAAAVLSSRNGQPSFLAVLGATFLPPIQLSFGFSLDRVGGIVGVHRRADADALRHAVRTGAAGDVLFATRPPANPLALVSAIQRLFPAQMGSHLVGPSLRLSWLSFGQAGSLLSLDVAVVVEIPAGKVVIIGVARAGIPGVGWILDLRLDVLGILDPAEKLVSIDASLVDSHVLGIFEVYGDAALRFSWGTPGYTVISIGGFYPGFNPEPARIPALRRVGLAISTPIPIIAVRAEGYFAITSNTIQLGGRWEIGISLVIEAHGFLEVDALVQFRPFHFEARVAAGFDVSVAGFSFASVRLEGAVSGPGPVVIRGSLSIDVFLFSISWDETFTLGTGPSDVLPTPPRLVDVIAEELRKPANVRSESIGDPHVVLKPRPARASVAAVPPTGTLRVQQRRAPLGLLVERVDGRPLAGAQGARVLTPGADVTDSFGPGTYVNLTDAEALNRPPFDELPSGRVLSIPDPPLSSFPRTPDPRMIKQIVIRGGHRQPDRIGFAFNLGHIAAITDAARRSPALSDATPLVTVRQEVWTAMTPVATHGFTSATAAHQFARYNDAVALAEADSDVPVSLAGVL